MEDSDLSKKAMLVTLNISVWTARKLDKKVTKEVAQKHGNDEKLGRYNKNLLASDDIESIQKVATESRQFHYDNTLPWQDKGGRILPSANYMQYSERLREFKAEFERRVQAFVEKYPGLVIEAKDALNGLYNANDYPSPVNIASLFNFEVEVSPLPSASDFRVELREDEADEIRKDIEQKCEGRAKAAMDDLFHRLHDAVSHMHERLADEKASFHNSLVDNIRELVDILPRLNVTADPALTKLVEDAKGSLCVYDPETLRKDKGHRATVACAAKAMIDKLNSYHG